MLLAFLCYDPTEEEDRRWAALTKISPWDDNVAEAVGPTREAVIAQLRAYAQAEQFERLELVEIEPEES